MVENIVWTDPAKIQLREIYNYYKGVAGKRIANKIRNKIYRRTFILATNPFAGPRENLLEGMSVEFRYLVEDNYKILYWPEPGTIFIAAVFDCRQNPEKMLKEITNSPYPTMVHEE